MQNKMRQGEGAGWKGWEREDKDEAGRRRRGSAESSKCVSREGGKTRPGQWGAEGGDGLVVETLSSAAYFLSFLSLHSPYSSWPS